MTSAAMRASDDDRERTVDVLRDAYGEGRLTLDEFDERTSAAYAARTWGELRTLTEDLPVQPAFELDPDGADQSWAGQGGTGQGGARAGLDRAGLAGHQPADQRLPALTPLRPEALPPAMGRRRSRPIGPLLPIVFIWAMIAAGSSNPAAAAALACLFVCLLAVRVTGGGRR